MRLASKSPQSDPDASAVLLPPSSIRDLSLADDAEGHDQDTSKTEDKSSGLTLVQAKTSEKLQNINNDAAELLHVSHNFPGHEGCTNPTVKRRPVTVLDPTSSSTAMLAMNKSAKGIAAELRDLKAIRQQSKVAEAETQKGKAKEDSRHQRPRHHPSKHDKDKKADKQDASKSKSQRRRKSSISHMACRECHRTETPEWRPGPDGAQTLCNVCGLIYAKRKRRRESLEQYASSWPS